MRQYSDQEIKEMENPREFFQTRDDFESNQLVFESLSSDDKLALAQKFVKDCPLTEIVKLTEAMEGLNAGGEDGMYNLLSEAIVMSHIEKLKDEKDQEAYQVLLDDNFNSGMYHKHKALVRTLLDKFEDKIAEKLAITAPDKFVKQLSQNIRIINDPRLSESMNAAMTLRQDIHKNLLGQHPVNFFIKNNPTDLCNQFPNLLAHCINGKEESIASNLSQVSPADQGKVNRCLEMMTKRAIDREDYPLSRLKKAFAKDSQVAKKESPLVSHSLLKHSQGGSYQSIGDDDIVEYSLIDVEMNEDSASEDENQRSCCTIL